MSLAPGTRLGVFELSALIGRGGMGEVYQATDTKLKRQVAIKILPASLAGDAERMARFQREAEVLASLNHPNIAAIYGLEESAGVTALVMELVEGDDLSQRIARGAIPLDEAVPIAKQIADALEAAHEQTIVHRDLKPANIKVRADGMVKVLDFGLAKLADSGAGGAGRPGGAGGENFSQAPTITTPGMPFDFRSGHPEQGRGVTQAGMILGTAAYMSPEQARGKLVDKRTDIWAFGAVLFEMLTGRRAFGGEDIAETLANVISSEPAWEALPPATPARIRSIVARCLVKDPRQRVRDMGDVRLALDGAFETAASPSTPTTISSGRGRRPWMAALAVAAALVVALAMPALRHLGEVPASAPPEMRVEITTPATDAPLAFALSPDGRALVFVASGDGPSRLWLRPLDQTEARPLAGTEGAGYPFWSPDSRAVGFFTASTLSRIDIAGGPPQVLANLPGSVGLGGSWSSSGTILFQRQIAGPLLRIAAAGGEVVASTRLDAPRQTAHRFPQFLPDGRHFLFYALGSPDAAGIYLGSLDGGDARRLTAADSAGAFLAPDRLAFVQQRTLMARRLDLASGALTGDPVTLADGVGVDVALHGGFAVSGDGTVAYYAGRGESRQLTWFDRTGKALGVAGESDTSGIRNPELSADGRRVAMARTVQGNMDIWLLDSLRSAITRLTFDPAPDFNPVWSPDGTRIAVTSNRKDAAILYLKPSNGSGPEEVLVASPRFKSTQDWSSDGRWLLYYEVGATTGRDLWAMDMTDADHRTRVVANTPFDEVLAQVSPDGRWIAYQTNESGRFEVVVQPFPDAGGKWQVSTGGGVTPRWRADGKELYFLSPDATMMAVPVTAAGTSFEAGTPVALFRTRIADGGALSQNRPQYAVARDGRFLINQPVANAATPITLILNWRPPAK